MVVRRCVTALNQQRGRQQHGFALPQRDENVGLGRIGPGVFHTQDVELEPRTRGRCGRDILSALRIVPGQVDRRRLMPGAPH